MSNLAVRAVSNLPNYFHVRIESYFETENEGVRGAKNARVRQGRFVIAMVDPYGEVILRTQLPVRCLLFALRLWRTNVPSIEELPEQLRQNHRQLKIEILPERHRKLLTRVLGLREAEIYQ